MVDSSLQSLGYVILKVVIPFDTPPEFVRALRPGDELYVGRASKNDIIIANPCVSREHAIIRWDGKGLSISDLKTRNGTKVNTLRVSKEASLRVGDCIEISSARIHVLRPDSDTQSLSSGRSMGLDHGTTVREPTQAFENADPTKLAPVRSVVEPTAAMEPLKSPQSLLKKVPIILGGCAIGVGVFWGLLQLSL